MPPVRGRRPPQASPRTVRCAAKPSSASLHQTGACNAHRWRHSSPAGHFPSRHHLPQHAEPTFNRRMQRHPMVTPFISSRTPPQDPLPRGRDATTCTGLGPPRSAKASNHALAERPAEPRSGPDRAQMRCSHPAIGHHRWCSSAPRPVDVVPPAPPPCPAPPCRRRPTARRAPLAGAAPICATSA